MTELEAEVITASLTRVWRPEEGLVQGFLPVANPLDARLRLPLGERIELLVSPYRFQLTRRDRCGEITGILSCGIKDGVLHYPAQIQSRDHPHKFEEFARLWAEAFRCNCWLSGCPIEASAHEKAEWMQDFTRQEVESWKLKV